MHRLFLNNTFAICFATAGFAIAAPTPSKLQVLSNGDAVAVAVVVNERNCDRDGTCTLRFTFGGKTGVMIYAHGDVEGAKPCGQDMAKFAWNVKDGTRVEARGRYRETRTYREIDICASPDAFLRNVP